MHTLVHSPSRNHFAGDSLSYSSAPSSSSSHLPYPELVYAHNAAPLYQPIASSSFNKLQIATGAVPADPPEPEEETAHPSRMPSSRTHPTEQPPHTAAAAAANGFGAVNTGGLSSGLSRALNHKERELLAHLDRLKFFLATAPSRWSADAGVAPALDPSVLPVGHPSSAHPALNRFLLPNSEYVSCVLWGGLYHITGTDIVRALVFRFEAFGRPVRNMKKFEEGVFSDLRNLKPGVDACLEEPKSPFLDLLFKYQCIRTQKKQKVFYWFSVPHDRLFLDALERDLKREKMGQEPTTVVVGEPAESFTYDPKRSLYEQFSRAQGAVDGEDELEGIVRRADEAMRSDGEGSSSSADKRRSVTADGDGSSSDMDEVPTSTAEDGGPAKRQKLPAALQNPNSPFFSMFSLFEGSPTYKQRRKKSAKGAAARTSPPAHMAPEDLVGAGLAYPRVPEPHTDRFGRDATRLSAAEMFMAQARGEFGSQSNPDLVATQKERQRRAMQELAGAPASHMRYGQQLIGPGVGSQVPALPPPQQRSASVGMQPFTNSAGLHPSIVLQGPGVAGPSASPAHPMGMYDQHRPRQQRTYPAPSYPQHHQLRTSAQSYADQQPAPSAMADVWLPDSAPRTKAFVCPLFSCGRMFRRMEHLKRHLRTHTLERPYRCQRCKKRFSRQDNLQQHYRTHLRRDEERAALGIEDDDSVSAEDEEIDELEDDDNWDGPLDFGEGIGRMPDVQMCEVEVQGQVHEVQGDEEGLVMTTGSSTITPTLAASSRPDASDSVQEIYYMDNTSTLVSTPSTQSPYMAPQASPGVQWTTQSQHASPAFTPMNISASQRMSQSYPGTMAVGEYVSSMSAPSHKAVFDHPSLYPPELVNAMSVNGPGPLRRHRSATPSIARYGDSIRRPFSATVSDGGSGRPPSRSYHPYAVATHQVHSAESSPMAYSVPLGYDSPQQMAMSAGRPLHSHSRSSSSGHSHMQQMINMEQMETESMQAYAHEAAMAPPPQQQQAATGYTEMYRTESPLQFSAAGMAAGGAYGLGLAQPENLNHPVQTMYTMDMDDAHAAQYGAHAVGTGYYAMAEGDPQHGSM